MNIKELKAVIDKLPDDMKVVVSRNDDDYLDAGAQIRFAKAIDRRGIKCLVNDYTEAGQKVLPVYWYH